MGAVLQGALPAVVAVVAAVGAGSFLPVSYNSLDTISPDMEQIYRSALKLMAPLTLEEVCQRSVEEACKLFGAKQGSIFWYEDKKLRKVYTNVPKREQLEPRPRGNVLDVFYTQKPRYLSLQMVQKGHPHFKEVSIKSITLIPLSHSSKSLGVMSLQSEYEKTHIVRQKQKLLLFGSLVSLAIRNVQLFAQKEEALKQRDLFMSLASHELKTPLAVIVMTLHLMERKSKKGGKIDSKWLETIKRNANKLKLLIDDLFSMSQINAGSIKIHRKSFSLIEACKKVISELSVIYQHQIKFRNALKGKDETIIADEEKISLVLTNIISNAAKFSPPDSKIDVTLSQKWSGFELKVKDRGIGIHEADQKKVFERYFQGKNRKNGLGLGLFLSREIIEAHDGEVNLTSVKKKGTIVSIWLPSK